MNIQYPDFHNNWIFTLDQTATGDNIWATTDFREFLQWLTRAKRDAVVRILSLEGRIVYTCTINEERS